MFGSIQNNRCNYQRCSAYFKEIVRCTYTVKFERLSERLAEKFLCFIDGSGIFAQRNGNGFGQYFYICLSVGSHGHFIHLQICRRYHIMCQVLFQFITQFFYVYIFISREIRTKIILTVYLSDNDRRFLDMRLCLYQALYFTEFYTQSTQFHLIVKPAEYHDISVFIPSGIVA